MPSLLVHDNDSLMRMEENLMELATNAFQTAGVHSGVFGVFSLDELESQIGKMLDSKVAIGVQYSHTRPLEIDFNSKASATASGGNAARMVAHEFLVILAVPADQTENTRQARYNVAKLLTILRRAIHGAEVAGDRSARRWNFQWEKPNVSESTDTTLFYSQLWQVALPLVASQQQSF